VARSFADEAGADGLLVFNGDGVTGHPDHARATAAALPAAERLGLAVLGWTVPRTVADALDEAYGAAFAGRESGDIDLVVTVDRARQLATVACHPSQAVPAAAMALWLADPNWLGFNARDSGNARRAGLTTRPLDQTLADTLGWETSRDRDRRRQAGLSDKDKQTLLTALRRT